MESNIAFQAKLINFNVRQHSIKSINDIYIFNEEEAAYIYSNIEKFHFRKELIYPFLSKEDQIKYKSDVKNFYEIIPGTTQHIKDEHLKKSFAYTISRSYYPTDRNAGYFSLYLAYDLNEFPEWANEYILRTLTYASKLNNDFFTHHEILSDEHKANIIYLCYLNFPQKIYAHVLAIVFQSIKSEEIKVKTLNQLFKLDDFHKNLYSRTPEIFMQSITSEDGKKFLFQSLLNIKNITNEALANLLPFFPIECCIDYFKKYGININFSRFICNIQPKDWLELYLFLETLEDSNKYIDINVLSQGKDAYERNFISKKVFDDIVFKHVINNSTLSIFEKIQKLSALYYDKDLLKVLNTHVYALDKQGLFHYIPELLSNISEKYELSEFPEFEKYIFEKYNIQNPKNANKFFSVFGSSAIPYLSTNNIINLINSDEDTFDKILALFNNDSINLNIHVINNITNSFLQRIFKLEESDCNIFSDTLNAIDCMPKNETYSRGLVQANLDKIKKVINIENIDKNNILTLENLFKKDPSAVAILHKLSDLYVAKKREIYIADNLSSSIGKLNLRKYYAKAYIKKEFFRQNDSWDIHYTLAKQYPIIEFLTEEEYNLVTKRERLEKIIQYKQNPNSNVLTPSLLEDLKILDNVLDKFYDNEYLSLRYYDCNAKYDYFMPEIDYTSLVNILSLIDPLKFKNEIGSNPQLYNTLVKILSKYKFFAWNNVFDYIAARADLDTDTNVIASIANNFSRIYEKFSKQDKKNQTLPLLLDLAAAYSSSSNKYSRLIGKENLNFIITNPGPYSSPTPKNIRIDKIPYYIKKMYNREAISIPPKKIEVDLSEDKRIIVTAGDIYNPINLTLGERCGSCCRIDGAFGELFDFALFNDNGFNVIFTNPENDSFVSKVTGIRNGNTVFLNELRYSVDDNYSSSDLIKAINELAKYLVESTKNDQHPIDNVIICYHLAMLSCPSIDLELDSMHNKFYSLPFSISDCGCVLYTSSEDTKTLKPYQFGNNHMDLYDPTIDFVKVTTGVRAIEEIQSIELIDELLIGKQLDTITIKDNHRPKKCISGYGWYVYIDNDGNIHEFIISDFKNNKKLLKLISEYKVKYLGGNKNAIGR